MGRKIKDVFKIIIYVIIGKIAFSIIIAIENVIREKVEYSSESIHSTANTIVFLTNSYVYDIIIGMSILIIGVLIGYSIVKTRISKLIIIGILVCIVAIPIGLCGIMHSYINITSDKIFIESLVFKEQSYQLKDIKEIHSFCEKISGKYSTSYRIHYKLILANGETLELSKYIPDEDIVKLDKVHRLLIDKYKIPYYSTGAKDENYTNVLNNFDNKTKNAIRDIFEEKTESLLILK
jgi:hypothetical protein